MRPARGWSWEGSGREGVERKEETSWAVVGSKGWKVVEEAEGSWRVSVESEGFRLPVRVPQKDMAIKRY